MRWIWNGALILIALTGPAWGTGLRVGVKLRQELDQPLIPVTRNFRPCFRQGPGGVPEIGLCPDAPTGAPSPRAPAAQPAPKPVPAPKPAPSRRR